jgi:hypothetical protein
MLFWAFELDGAEAAPPQKISLFLQLLFTTFAVCF